LIRRRDRLGLVTLVPLSADTIPVDRALPPRDRLAEEMHLIDQNNRILSGAEAVAAVLAYLPRLAWLGKLLSLPGIRQVASAAYRFIARHRRLFGGASVS
jgi:predicted DCC family thiol-disulfide oxidoreductase YuxK